ncbi:MAG: hypothetical protein RLZZ350_660 [Verrucomicrobiota bacterium]
MLNAPIWQLEPFLKLLLRLFFSFALGMVALGGLRGAFGEVALKTSVWPLVISMVTAHGALLVLAGIFLREHALRWRDAFGLARQPGASVALGAASAVVVLCVIWPLVGAVKLWCAQHGLEFDEQTPVQLLREQRGVVARLLLGLFAIVLAPVAEEIFFRGLAYPLLKQHTSRPFAVVVVSVLFALLHGNVPLLLPLAVLAVGLTLLYEWTGNLLTSITVHALFNAANFAALFFEPQLKQLLGPSV